MNEAAAKACMSELNNDQDFMTHLEGKRNKRERNMEVG